MIANKKLFSLGLALMVGFLVVLVLIFMPIFKGQNGLDYLDSLFNSISKGSAYKNIQNLKENITPFDGNTVALSLAMGSEDKARQTAPLFEKSGVRVEVSGSDLKISGDLGRILQNALRDADLMYANNSEAIKSKYGIEGRRVLFNWWTVAKEMEKALKKQKQFKEAKIVAEIKKKAIEMGFNYYGIEPQRIGDRWGIVLFALIFYVVYTLWYGFAVMYMFEGWGMQLEH